MSYTKLEKILGGILYYKLYGQGESSEFKGGLFAAFNKSGIDINHILSVIQQLPEQDINTPVTLDLIARNIISKLSNQNTIKILNKWVERAKPETISKTFQEFAQSLNLNQALEAKPVYQIFLKKYPIHGIRNNRI